MSLFRFGIASVVIAKLALAQPESVLAEADRLLKAGNYAQAIRSAEAAGAAFESAGNRDGARNALSIVGAASYYQGNYSNALDFFHRAMRIDRELGDVAGEVKRLNNLGAVHSFRGQYAEAYTAYRTALDRLEGQQGKPWFASSKQLSLGNMAVLYQTLGQDSRALELYRELRQLPIEWEPSVEAQLLTNLAVVYRRLGDPRKALDAYRQARRLFDRDPHAAGLSATLRNIGVVEARDLNEPAAALATFQEALALAERSGNRREAVQEHLFLGETLLRLARFADAESRFQKALAGAASLGLADERWTGLAGLAHAHEGLGRREEARKEYEEAIAVIESSRAGLSTSLRDEFLAGKRDVYDALIRLLLEQPAPPLSEAFLRMEQARARNLKDVKVHEEAPSLAAVQSRLDPDAAVVEYWTAGDSVAALWITKASAGILRRQFAKEEQAAVDAAVRSLRSPGEVSGIDAASRALLAPELADRLSGVKKIVVVPDGSPQLLPFEALRNRDGRPMVETFDVSYLPSAVLLRGARKPAWRWPWQTTVAAFADPLVPPSTSFDQAWPRLGHSGEEVRMISETLAGRDSVWIGTENLKRRFLDRSDRAPILHLATHAAVDLRDSRRSRLVFTPEGGNAASQYLYRAEIAQMDLTGVELVTLAACESEQGRHVRGEGLEGFGRAFLAAGAASSVGSLWKVSDRATLAFMRSFYGYLAAGATKAEALRRAKLDFIASKGELSKPYYWAAFVLMGDGNSVAVRVAPWWAVMGAALALAAAVAVWFRR